MSHQHISLHCDESYNWGIDRSDISDQGCLATIKCRESELRSTTKICRQLAKRKIFSVWTLLENIVVQKLMPDYTGSTTLIESGSDYASRCTSVSTAWFLDIWPSSVGQSPTSMVTDTCDQLAVVS